MESNNEILQSKKILVVDDEPDVIETLKGLLDFCEIDAATDYESARKYLQAKAYDAAVLDIMGVRGYDLLEICQEKSIPVVMLTSHALSPEHMVKSIRKGAASYVPKEKISEIASYLKEAISATRDRGLGHPAWFARLRPYFQRKFGLKWEAQFEDFKMDIQELGSILVPTDFSLHSCEAFTWAAFFARKFKSKVLILHVISEKVANELISIPGNPWEAVLEREEKQMKEYFSACLVGDFGDAIEKETLVEVGSPHLKILDTASKRNISIIVMSTHGRTGIAHALMGSIAEKIVQRAPCPVFLVRPRIADEG